MSAGRWKIKKKKKPILSVRHVRIHIIMCVWWQRHSLRLCLHWTTGRRPRAWRAAAGTEYRRHPSAPPPPPPGDSPRLLFYYRKIRVTAMTFESLLLWRFIVFARTDWYTVGGRGGVDKNGIADPNPCRVPFPQYRTPGVNQSVEIETNRNPATTFGSIVVSW